MGMGVRISPPPPPLLQLKAVQFVGIILIGIFGILLTACGDDDEPENTAPTIADQTFSIAENVAVDAEVGTVQATDAENDDLTFSVTAGNTGDVFAVNASSGLLTLAKALDFETTPAYTLKVSVSDGTDSNAADITINVTDVDEAENTAPTITNQTFSIAEDAAVDAEVGIVQATDAENDELTFSITSGNADDAFAINASSGLLMVAKALDFETTMVHTLIVSVSDGMNSSTADITINVADVNEAPNIANQTFSVAEDAYRTFGSTVFELIDVEVGTVQATDDENDELAFSINSGNTSDVFAMDASSGTITVAKILDFETVPAYTLNVSVSDGMSSSTADITINVTDAVEGRGSRLPGKDIDLDSDNSSPRALWSDGTTLWVADRFDDKLYAYTLATGARDADKDFDLAEETNSPSGLWSDGTTLYVLSNSKIYAYTLATGTRDATKEFDLDSDNSDARGLWSDGTTVWVADGADPNNPKIYAYTLATGARDAAKEFDINIGFPADIWSDGTDLWVGYSSLFTTDDMIAYTLSTGAGAASINIRSLGETDNASIPRIGPLEPKARGIWSDGSTIWIAEDTTSKIYAYQLK